MTEQILFGLLAIAFGPKLLFFDSKSAKKAVDFQNKTFGFKFGSKEIKSARIGYLVGGLIFIAAGIASIFGIGGFKLH